jgi:hypothetical protein
MQIRLFITWKVCGVVEGYTWTEREKCVTCWSNFPLQGVHRFKSSQLSNMSNHLPCCYHHVDN